MRKSRTAIIGGTVATMVLTPATPAFANWSGFLSQVMNGYESRRWDDEQYSQILFTGCDQGYATSVTVNLWEDISLNYDNFKGDATYTNCFKSSTAVSAAAWTGLPVNDFYFEISSVLGSNEMSARIVDVDTTAAD